MIISNTDDIFCDIRVYEIFCGINISTCCEVDVSNKIEMEGISVYTKIPDIIGHLRNKGQAKPIHHKYTYTRST